MQGDWPLCLPTGYTGSTLLELATPYSASCGNKSPRLNFVDILAEFKTFISLIDAPREWLDASRHHILHSIHNFAGLSAAVKSDCIHLLNQTQIHWRLALQTLVQCKDYPLSSAIFSSELSGKNEVAALLKYQSIRQALLSTLDVIVKHNPVQEKLLALDDIDFCARVLIVVRDASRFMALVAERRDDAQSLLNLLQILLDQPRLDKRLQKSFRKAIVKLSKSSGLYPECLVIRSVRIIGEAAVAGGSFGDVWKGEVYGRAIAVKQIKVYERSDIQKLLRDFSHEAVLWRQLSHPNVLPFYGVYHFDTARRRICFLSPWMENGTIVQFLERMPNADRPSLMLDVARGLDYLHTMEPSIVHGDLKGVNVLITPSARACLADFGLATATESQILGLTSGMGGRATGTARWLAPELLAPESEDFEGLTLNCPATDLYAFGCVSYEIFSGRIPFHDIKNSFRVALTVLRGMRPTQPSQEISVRNGLDSELWGVIKLCWRQDPDERPTSSQIVKVLEARSSRFSDSRRVCEWDDQFVAQLRSDLSENFFSLFLADLDIATGSLLDTLPPGYSTPPSSSGNRRNKVDASTTIKTPLSSGPERPPYKKGLLIGISYQDQSSPYDVLVGVPRDTRAMRNILIDVFQYDPKDVVIMLETSKNPDLIPTRTNMLREIDKLVGGACDGDHLYFHYAGHSTQMTNTNNTNMDDVNGAIVPIDDRNYEKAIMDNDLRRHLVDPLPIGAKLFAIFDTSHSASLLDLPHVSCNRVYVPWISKGARRENTVFSNNVRRNALLAEAIYDSTSRTKADSELETFTSIFYDSPTLPIQRTTSPEPMDRAFECHGFCQHTPDELPNVVALGACTDEQQAWDDELGRGMTHLLIEILKENPHRSLKEVLTELSHRTHRRFMRLHAVARGVEKWKRRMIDAQGCNSGMFEETSTDELDMSSGTPESSVTQNTEAASSVVDVEPLEMHNFQDPQLSSNRRLDMNVPFVL